MDSQEQLISLSIVPIVEGRSEVESVPILMRRFLPPNTMVEIARPVKVARNKVVKPGELEKAIELAKTRPSCRAIVVLLDADDDCPKQIAPELLRRAQDAAANARVSVVFPKRELEAWFVGSIESLRGMRGIGDDAVAPSDPEAIRDAKGWLRQTMERSRAYAEVDDQPALASRFDFDLAHQRCRSFRKFRKDFEALLEALLEELGQNS